MKLSSRRTLRPNPIVLALMAAAAQAPVMAQTSAESSSGNSSREVRLKEVTVRDTYEREDLPALAPGRKAAKGARLGILGATAITDAPVHVNAYTRELAEDWGALTLQDVLENDSAVVFTTNRNHLLQNFNLRGLDVSAMDIATNGLYGIAPANSIPIELFERVEVMRGPNVLLLGMPPAASVAGTVNMVTKRALGKPIADLTFSYNSRSYGQVHVDVGKRFGDEQRLGLRFNGVYGNGGMGADGEKQERRVAGLALDYLGDRVRASLDVYSSTNEIRNGSPGMFSFTSAAPALSAQQAAALGVAALPAAPALGVLLSPPSGDVNMFRGTHGEYDNSGYLARTEFDFNRNWQGYVAVGGSEAEGKGLLFGTRAIVVGADGTTRGAIYHVHSRSERRTAEAGVIGKLETGSVKHRVQVSWNVLKHEEGTTNTPCNYCYVTNMYDPVAPAVLPAAPAQPSYTTNNEFTSLALADTLSFAEDRVLLTVGARQQNVEQPLSRYDSSRLSPMLAAVVRPWGGQFAVFGNYTEGLEPGQVVGVAYANAGETLAPRQTRQKEVGVKLQTGELTHTVSTYQIERSSFISDGALPLPSLVDDGKQRLTGLEWSVYGRIAPTLSLLGGITHIKSRQLNTGKETYGTPEWRARIGLDWDTPVRGLTVGGRVIHTGSQWVNSANTLRLPSWNRLDLNFGYETRFGGTPVQFNASVENVADKKYWIGTFTDGFVMPGAPRTFRLSAKLSFL